MKCIKVHGGEAIKHVSDEAADAQVSAGKASYVNKSQWKAQDLKGHSVRANANKALEARAAVRKVAKENKL